MKKYVAVLGVSYLLLAIAVLALGISSPALIGLLLAVPAVTTTAFHLSEKFSLNSPKELKGFGAGKYARKLFNNSANILYLVNHEGNILRANRASQEVVGHESADNLHLAEVVHPDDLDLVKDQLATLFDDSGLGSGGGRNRVEIRLVEQDSPGNSSPEVIPTSLRGTKVTEQAGILEFVDKGKLKRLKKRLREAGARYRYLIEDAIDTLDSAVVLIDKKGEVVWVNKTMEEFFSLDRRDLIGQTAEGAMSYYASSFAESGEFTRKATRAHEEGERVNSEIFSVEDQFGRTERILEYRSIPIETERYEGGRIEHYIDVTEVKQLEEDLRRKTERLQKSNEKLEEFSRSISHDLKAPLQTLEGYSHILMEDYESELDQDGIRALEALSDTTQRLRNRIEGLLTYSSIKMEEEKFEELDLSELLGELEEDLRYLLEGVRFEVPDDLPAIYGNETLLTELFSNLITNAVKYNDKEDPMVEVGWKQHSDGYLVWVRDNGQGIKERYLEKVFKVFEKLNPRDNPEGTGIGLAVCKRIVEEHRGEIWAESEPGEGTTFYFTLPGKENQTKEKVSAGEMTDGINYSRISS
ncbi:PAS domain S-box protein [Candidatus Bipolaricaulota bacterium]|nr:PAS domain S-box protein [Candidatus Bipolaricaulota bacterium]